MNKTDLDTIIRIIHSPNHPTANISSNSTISHSRENAGQELDDSFPDSNTGILVVSEIIQVRTHLDSIGYMPVVLCSQGRFLDNVLAHQVHCDITYSRRTVRESIFQCFLDEWLVVS
jgi:hypothetical protein